LSADGNSKDFGFPPFSAISGRAGSGPIGTSS
jgi:hypothetical protein